MSRISVLIVDDHPVVRLGIRSLFEREPDVDVIGEAGSGEGALCLVEISSPRVVLLDSEVPGLSGLGLILISFLSPCVLPLVPAYVGYLSGHALGGLEEEQIG